MTEHLQKRDPASAQRILEGLRKALFEAIQEGP